MFSKLRFGLLLVIICLGSSISFPSPTTDVSAEQILFLVNQDRAKNGLPELKINSVLNLAALAKAQDMLKHNYFDHISPLGLKPWHFFKSLGYNYIYAGENLALNYTNPYELEESWMNSPKHRDNILSPNYSELGLAIVSHEDKTVIVQFFGTKESKLTFDK
jgi:uncharacterized protein YkwD